MAWFTRKKPPTTGGGEGERHVRTEGLWQKCENCGQIIWRKALEDNLFVCPKCDHHFRLDAVTRLRTLFDNGEYEEFDRDLASTDPLGFVDAKRYKDRLAGMQKASGMRDALVSGGGTLNGRYVYICSLELKFIGGSMG